MANTGPSELIIGLLLLLGIATLLGLFLVAGDASPPPPPPTPPDAREMHRLPAAHMEAVPSAPPAQSGLPGV